MADEALTHLPVPGRRKEEGGIRKGKGSEAVYLLAGFALLKELSWKRHLVTFAFTH